MGLLTVMSTGTVSCLSNRVNSWFTPSEVSYSILVHANASGMTNNSAYEYFIVFKLILRNKDKTKMRSNAAQTSSLKRKLC